MSLFLWFRKYNPLEIAMTCEPVCAGWIKQTGNVIIQFMKSPIIFLFSVYALASSYYVRFKSQNDIFRKYILVPYSEQLLLRILIRKGNLLKSSLVYRTSSVSLHFHNYAFLQQNLIKSGMKYGIRKIEETVP